MDDSLEPGSDSESIDDVAIPGELFESSDSNIITARGTEDGLVIRIDGRSEWETILSELKGFIEQRRKFLEGGEVSIEWLDCLPTKEQSQSLESLLKDEYEISIVCPKKKPPRPPKKEVEEQVEKKPASVERIGKARDAAKAVQEMLELGDPSDELTPDQIRQMTDLLGEEGFLDEEANARLIFGTLRSGQRVETPFGLVVVGDVNPGADLVAGGDIVVLGSLRGTAHAGAYEDDSEGRVIIAMHMQPMQLRIGSVISRGSDEVTRGAEVARIDDRRIVVEGFQPRQAAALVKKEFSFDR